MGRGGAVSPPGLGREGALFYLGAKSFRPLGGRRRRLVQHRAVRVGRHQEEGEGVVACFVGL